MVFCEAERAFPPTFMFEVGKFMFELFDCEKLVGKGI